MSRKRYRPWNPEESYLLPPSPREWLPNDHLLFFVLDVLTEIDLGAIEGAIQQKDTRGERPYDPLMMTTLLVYAYCTGVFSSRKMERATYDNVAFRVLVGGSHPHFTTINTFRRVHRTALATLFLSVLQLCKRAGLVKLGHVAIDGTKVEANASKHKAMSYDRMLSQEKRLAAQIEELLSQADAIDEEEDRLYGAGNREWELPEELRRREDRIKRIKEAKAELEQEARQQRASDLREQATGMRETAKSHPNPRVRSRQAGQAKRREAQANLLFPEADEDEVDKNHLPRRTTPVTVEGKPRPKTQRNFTDPDSHLMMGPKGFAQSYNAQAAVDSENQIILAAGVTNQPADNANLLPMLERVVATTGLPEVLSADYGYWAKDVPARSCSIGVEPLIATGRVKHGEVGAPVNTGEPLPDLKPLERMRWRLNTDEGRKLYRRRKVIVEPVFGQIKAAMGFRRFSFRGLQSVDDEWSLVCACHNLLKLFRSGWQPAPA